MSSTQCTCARNSESQFYCDMDTLCANQSEPLRLQSSLSAHVAAIPPRTHTTREPAAGAHAGARGGARRPSPAAGPRHCRDGQDGPDSESPGGHRRPLRRISARPPAQSLSAALCVAVTMVTRSGGGKSGRGREHSAHPRPRGYTSIPVASRRSRAETRTARRLSESPAKSCHSDGHPELYRGPADCSAPQHILLWVKATWVETVEWGMGC